MSKLKNQGEAVLNTLFVSIKVNARRNAERLRSGTVEWGEGPRGLP